MRSFKRPGTVFCLAVLLCNVAIAADNKNKTGDDDDIDDLIIERAEKAEADKARASQGGNGLNETEDDLYVGSQPQQGGNAGAAPQSNALTPASGPWGEFVTVSGTGFGGADGVQVRLYPNDDDSQPAAMRQTATLRGRDGSNAIQIQIPQNPAASGWTGDFANGVVRVYVYLPGQLEPVLAGRYTVGAPVNREALRAGLGKNLASAKQPTLPDGNLAEPPAGETLPPRADFDPQRFPAGFEPPIPADNQIPERSPFAQAGQIPSAPGLPGDARSDGGDLELRDDRRPKGAAPENVSAAVLGPTSARIDWQAAAGAIGYTVTRAAKDGNIEELSNPDGTLVTLTDTGLSPRSKYSYTVVADHGRGMQRGVSESVSIATPLILPPAGFVARRKSDNSISLSWTPRPDAVFYQIRRNGTALKATGSSYDDNGLTPGDYSYTIQTVIKLKNDATLFGETSSPLTLRLRPFTIVAAGDSVMWGQGVAESSKFTTLTKNWIQGLLPNKPLVLTSFAHSGAIIRRGTAAEEALVLPGEMPSEFPSISRQILDTAPAQVSTSQVDLILLDGCINDISVKQILVGAIVPINFDYMLTQDIELKCGSLMGNLLRHVATLYPNAKIVVTGYFPIASDQSDISDLIGLVWGATSVAAIPASIAAGIIAGAGSAVVVSALPAPIAAIMPALKPQLVRRAKIFDEESERQLRHATTVYSQEYGGRIKFAEIPYGASNSYGAPSTWLWHIPWSYRLDEDTVVAMRKDQVYDARLQQCQQHQPTNLSCYIASISHPNIAGAAAYSRSIQQQLTPFIAEWAEKHSDAVQDPQTPLYTRVEYAERSLSGGKLTAHVADWTTGIPVDGDVFFDGRVVGKIGESLTYSFAASNATDIRGTIQPTGHAEQSFLIPVRSVTARVTQSADYPTRSITVTVTDRETGQALQGTVRVKDRDGRTVSAATGQTLRYPACVAMMQDLDDDGKPVQVREPIDCQGSITVPHYRNALILDQTGDY